MALSKAPQEVFSSDKFTFWVTERTSCSSLGSTIDINLHDDEIRSYNTSRLRLEQCASAKVPPNNTLELNQQSLEAPTTRFALQDRKAPRANVVAKVREGVRLSSHKFRVRLAEKQNPYTAISAKGQFQHYYIDPLCFWQGKNDRTLLSQTLALVRVEDRYGNKQSLVNAGSHNYAGFYRATSDSEQLQRLCLEKLPLCDIKAVPSLADAMNEAVCEHFRVDFCCTTSTGFGSNLLAMPAIVDESWLVLMDEKSHSSMHTGAFLAETGCIKKFRHNDMVQLESMLDELSPQYKKVLVAVEGFYSMDGTVPALAELYLLKKKYAFVIYCDEAHSFLSIGSGGRGCLELWNDENPDAMLPDDLIDIRTATLSKAVGGLGGVVFGAARFEDAVRSRSEHLHKRGGESVSTSTLVQALYVLGQPQRLRRQLHHLHHMTIFCKKELQRFGVHVYGDAATPILPVHAGRPTLSCKLSYKLRQLGVLATPINVPAVKFWESRVRVTLSADFSDDQVNKLLDSIIDASHSVGITKKVRLPRNQYKYAGCDVAVSNEEEEHRTCVRNIHGLIQKDFASQGSYHSSSIEAFTRNCGNAVIRVGHNSRARYGLGSSGSRWVSGTFSPHLSLEQLLAATGNQEAAMTFSDAEFGLSSTIAALCRPLLGYKKHYLLVPSTARETVREGLRIASKRDMPEVVEYNDLDDLYATMNRLSRRNNTIYFTIYIETVTNKNALIDISLIIENLQTQKTPSSSGMTLLLDDTHGLGHHGPNRLGMLGAAANLKKRTKAAATNQVDDHDAPQILTYGSFYRAFGLSGGYLAGDEVLISELRYTSRGYMYSTSPQPFVMDMVRRALRGRVDGCDDCDGGA